MSKGGIQFVCLAELGVKVKADVQYKWFVTMVIDADQRSKDYGWRHHPAG